MVLHLFTPVELAGMLVCAGNYPQVVPQHLKGQGRGLVASQPIRAGEQILAVPERLVLFPPTAAAGMVTPSCIRHVCPSAAVLKAPPGLTEAQAYKACNMVAKQWLQGYEFAWTPKFHVSCSDVPPPPTHLPHSVTGCHPNA
jgi:hypothetical protein